LFGWKCQMLGPDMAYYVLVTTAEADVKPGAPAGAINHPVPIFRGHLEVNDGAHRSHDRSFPRIVPAR
jgi:hypothetical protein